ncbi:MAG: hypothetical protein IIA12_09150, partial [Proteobacteria bacterium]|nr:hypothetical protein [Pseudomonadota bacterium]
SLNLEGVAIEPPRIAYRSTHQVMEFARSVLGPLAEIAPQLRHPETGKLISEHWAEYDKESHFLVATGVMLGATGSENA